MIDYILYVYDENRKKYAYFQQVKYQAKIIVGEVLRYQLEKYRVIKVEHDIDANAIDLYLEIFNEN